MKKTPKIGKTKKKDFGLSLSAYLDPENKISDESKYHPRHKDKIEWAINIPFALIYKLFLWANGRK